MFIFQNFEKSFLLRYFFISLRILFVVAIPLWLVTKTIQLIPKTINIQFDYKCENQIDGEVQCIKQRSTNFETSFEDVEEKIDIIKRLSSFSKPLSSVVLFKVNAVNKSFAVLEISSPPQKIENEISVKCDFNPAYFSKKYSLEDTLAFIKRFADDAEKCQLPAPLILNNQEFVWGSNAWLTIKINEEYGLEFDPDFWSFIFLYIIYILIMLATIPLFKQAIMFINQGSRYFKR